MTRRTHASLPSHRRTPVLAATVTAAALLAGCASPVAPVTDRVVLLPQTGGGASAVEVVAGGQRLRLDQPYASAVLQAGVLRPATSDAAAVMQRYGALLALQPVRPRSFVIPFESNANRLAPAAAPLLAEMRAALALLPAAEVIVIGHTDRVDSVEARDKLSLLRARAVDHMLVEAGVDRAIITVLGRGEHAPLVSAADELAEARNRCVEIKIR